MREKKIDILDDQSTTVYVVLEKLLELWKNYDLKVKLVDWRESEDKYESDIPKQIILVLENEE